MNNVNLEKARHGTKDEQDKEQDKLKSGSICPLAPYADEGASFSKFKVRDSQTLYTIPRNDLLEEIKARRREIGSLELSTPVRLSTVFAGEGDIIPIIKGILVNRKAPIVVDVPVFPGHGWDTWYQETIITLPTSSALLSWVTLQTEDTATNSASPSPTKKRGWHAVVITGYDNNKGLKFKNSWGPNWGKGGYGWFVEDYIRQYSRLGIAVL